MIKSLGGKFTLSDDSHGPLYVANNYHLLLAYLKETGVTEVYHLVKTDAGVVVAEIEDIQNNPFWGTLRRFLRINKTKKT